jgi:hypothetical protein
MRLSHLIILGAIILLITSGCGGGDNPWTGPTGAVGGQVVDEGTGKGIVGVTVKCGNDMALTGEKGIFLIDQADTGVETATASGTGYIGLGKETKQVTVIENSTVDVGTLRLARLTDDFVYLADLSAIAFNDVRVGKATFKNHAYDQTIMGDDELADNDAVAEFFIGGKFTQFKATAGVDDSSSYPSQYYKFLVLVDDVKEVDIERSAGEAMNLTVDVTGATYVRLEIRCQNSAAGRAGGHFAGFGDARVVL